jgi:large subunit ribosomal protein L49
VLKQLQTLTRTVFLDIQLAMSRIQPLSALLRPLAAPRPATYRQALRFSSASRLRADGGQRAAELAAAEARTEADNPNPPSSQPEGHSIREPFMLSPPRYHVSLSASGNYPVYTDYKRGGNLRITTVRKITGDVTALKNELRLFLGLKEDQVFINDLTKQVIVKVRYSGKRGHGALLMEIYRVTMCPRFMTSCGKGDSALRAKQPRLHEENIWLPSGAL